jgi:hypothetical protein
MKLLKLHSVALVFFAGAGSIVQVWGDDATTAAYPPERVAFLTKAIQDKIGLIYQSQQDPKSEVTVRDIGSAAQCYLLLGDLPKAQEMMRYVFRLQEMNSASPSFGRVLWQRNHPEIKDDNSVDFTAFPLAAGYARFGAQLPVAFQKEARPHLEAFITALLRRHVEVGYTNIYLMHLASLALLGESMQDPRAALAASAQLDAWLAYTRAHGIEEYDSANYSIVQIESLEMLYNYSRNEALKPKVKTALDLLWADLAANYFEGAQILSGSQSRSYNWLFGDDAANEQYYLVGLRDLLPLTIGFNDNARAWANVYPPDSYRPDASILALAKIPERIVVSQFGNKPGSDRYNYVTPNYAIGSSDRFYLLHDKQISVSLASAKPLPFILFVPDVFDSPYGHQNIREASGHLKVAHLADTLASVQTKGDLLVLADVSNSLGKEYFAKNVTSVASNLVFPANVDALFLNGKPLALAPNANLPLAPGATLALREGKAAVAMRFFAADGIGGAQPSFALKYDGTSWGAARLVAYHDQGVAQKVDNKTPIRCGFFILATKCDSDAAFDSFVRQADGLTVEQGLHAGAWQAMVNAPDGNKLAAVLNLTTKQAVARRVNGASMPTAPLQVNGVDLVAKYLGGAP